MTALRVNHVSIPCRDLDESERFYREVFGLERIPSFTFARPVRWYAVGDQQLHLMLVPDAEPFPRQHFAFDVDDFESTLQALKRLGALDSDTEDGAVFELPDGAVQCYARDPAGNLLEIDWPDVRTLDRAVVGEIRRRADQFEQAEESQRARLYHAAEAPARVV